MEPTRKAEFRLTTAEDQFLPTYDNTKLMAMNQCPTYGILRYQMHKRMYEAGRSLALECGTAMHEVFAWVRLCTLYKDMDRTDPINAFQLVTTHGNRLFGTDRFAEIRKSWSSSSDMIDMCKHGSITVLDTCGYYDDPRDKRRTLTNMEECGLAYIDRWRWDHPVWIRDPTDPKSDVGIEIPFDIVIHITDGAFSIKEFRLTGKIDGIHVQPDGMLTLHENKTASRLNEAWLLSFNLASQVTGYCVAASVFTQDVVNRAEVFGLAVPLPKSYDYGGYVKTVVTRENYHYTRWIDWLVHTIELYERYENNPFDAPKYTHSCNRYYRPCQFIPFCDTDEHEQHIMIAELTHDEWSPLHRIDGSQVEEG